MSPPRGAVRLLGHQLAGKAQHVDAEVEDPLSELRLEDLVSIISGIDSFDLKTFVEFGGQQISFHDVRKALKRGEQYIKLADGSIGQIPQEWLEKYKHLWGLAEETADGFRVSDLHLPL